MDRVDCRRDFGGDRLNVKRVKRSLDSACDRTEYEGACDERIRTSSVEARDQDRVAPYRNRIDGWRRRRRRGRLPRRPEQ